MCSRSAAASKSPPNRPAASGPAVDRGRRLLSAGRNLSLDRSSRRLLGRLQRTGPQGPPHHTPGSPKFWPTREVSDGSYWRKRPLAACRPDCWHPDPDDAQALELRGRHLPDPYRGPRACGSVAGTSSVWDEARDLTRKEDRRRTEPCCAERPSLY